jgi:geranylgeranyl reductase family protein
MAGARPEGSLRNYDLIIAGASFAGLACARTAALRGLRVAVLDRKADPGELVRTTGILVKEAAEEVDIPSHLTRLIRGVRLYSPDGHHVDHSAPGYYFLATDTPNLMRWMADEAKRAGAELMLGTAFRDGVDTGASVEIAEHGLSAKLLIGADGAASAVARCFGLDRNERFLGGIEYEYEPDEALDGRLLHCYLDSNIAPGYIAWAVPGVGVMQVGAAARHGKRPDIEALVSLLQSRYGIAKGRIVARRSGIIPAGATLKRTHSGRVMLIGDAAGHVSPLTGGGIAQTLRLGRRTAQLASDWLMAGAIHPAVALAREAPRFRTKLLMRRAFDMAPPNWVWNMALRTMPFRSVAQSIYFHRRSKGEDATDRPATPASDRRADQNA